MSDPGPSATQSQADATSVTHALGALHRLALVHARPELAEAAQAAIDRCSGAAFRIVVMGEYKVGKSSLVNALVDAPVCSVDDDIATAARLEVGFADPAGARRWFRGSPTHKVAAVDIAPSDAATAGADPATTLVRVGLPRQLLRSGLVLVDTPGAGGIASAASVVTASSLADAHAVLFVSDVSQELTRAEADAIVDASERCPHVVIVETKTDLYPHWRDIVRADRKHLKDLGLDVSVLPVANNVRRLALTSNSPDLNRESGFPDLLSLINDRFVASAEDAVTAGALHTAQRVYAHLREPLAQELEILGEGRDDAEAEQAIASARAQVETFRERAGGWQQKLGDGCTDLAAAVDVDLRDRFRTLIKDSETVLDAADPDQIWDEFELTLYRRTAEELDKNLTLLRERADEVAQRLADAVADDEEELFYLGDHIEGGVGPSAVAERQEAKTGTPGTRAQQAFRAGYGSAMPILMIGGMALGVLGLGTVVLPLAAAAGVMGGRKALTDDRERGLAQRRQQAKVAVKKYTDEALFRAAAERKHEQRKVQRLLRDHFGARVKELGATRQRALQQAELAAKADQQERELRLTAVHDQLVQVEDIARAMAAP